jgi:hypothetical protein
MTAFWDVTPCSVVDRYHPPERANTSIFRAKTTRYHILEDSNLTTQTSNLKNQDINLQHHSYITVLVQFSSPIR